MNPAEVQWRLLRAERRALDGRDLTTPAVILAHTIVRMRKLLIEARAPKPISAIDKRTIPIRVPFEAGEVHTETDGTLILSKATLRPHRTRRVVFLESKPAPVIYGWAIEYLDKRIKELLPSVSISELSGALTKLKTVRFMYVEKLVLDACWRIFARTHAEPKSGLAVHGEIKAHIGKETLPTVAGVYDALNRLDIPTKRGKAGPARGARRRTSRKRARKI